MSELYCYTGQGGLPKQGFGTDLFEQPSPARDTLKLALTISDIPNTDIHELATKGTDQYGNKITDIRVCQTIQVAYSLAAETQHTEQTNPQGPVVRLPHSLGLFSAMIAAGGYHEDWETNLRVGMDIVNGRGRRTAEAPPGKMAALLFPSDQTQEIEEICAAQGLNIAVINGAGFYTMSGPEDAITEASKLFKPNPNIKFIPLAIERAFHHPVLMREAKAGLSDDFKDRPLRRLNGKMILSTGHVTDDPVEVWAQLMNQLTDTYDWNTARNTAISLGFTSGIEMGGNRIQSTEAQNKKRNNPNLDITVVKLDPTPVQVM